MFERLSLVATKLVEAQELALAQRVLNILAFNWQGTVWEAAKEFTSGFWYTKSGKQDVTRRFIIPVGVYLEFIGHRILPNRDRIVIMRPLRDQDASKLKVLQETFGDEEEELKPYRPNTNTPVHVDWEKLLAEGTLKPVKPGSVKFQPEIPAVPAVPAVAKTGSFAGTIRTALTLPKELPFLWYENDKGDRWVPDMKQHGPFVAAPEGFIYQHSSFPFMLRHTILRDVLPAEVEACRHDPKYVVPTFGWVEGLEGRECKQCHGTQMRHATGEWPAKWEAYGSRELMAMESGYQEDLALAIANSKDYSLGQAILIAANACERCTNVLGHKYGLGWGYTEGSDEWRQSGTECDFCKDTRKVNIKQAISKLPPQERKAFDDGFDQFRDVMGAEKVNDFLATLGLGPNYVPAPPKTYECPKCGGHNATYHEEHPDTDMNEMVLRCPDCKSASKTATVLKTAILRECAEKDIDPDRPRSEQKWCLYSKSTGKLLGRHPTKEHAMKQEQAIHVHKGALPEALDPKAIAKLREEFNEWSEDQLARLLIDEGPMDPKTEGGKIQQRYRKLTTRRRRDGCCRSRDVALLATKLLDKGLTEEALELLEE